MAPTGQAQPDAPEVTAPEAAPAPSILDVDLCNWVNLELIGDTIQFGGPVMLSPQEQQTIEVGPAERQSLTCDISTHEEGEVSPWKTAATITLMSGGPEVSAGGTYEAEPFEHQGVEGLTQIYGGLTGVARAAVQLEPGIALSVEGFETVDGFDTTQVGEFGVLPLTEYLIDGWIADVVPRVAPGSFADAAPFCDDLPLDAGAQQVPLEEGEVVVAYSRGGANTYGGGRGWDLTPFDGSVECGYRSAPLSEYEERNWPWRAPDDFTSASVSLKFEQYPDPDDAAALLAQHAESADPASCTGIAQVGQPPSPCGDGSGMSSREGGSGIWVAFGGMNGVSVAQSATELATGVDATITAALATLQDVRLDPLAYALDPRYGESDTSETPPGGLDCAAGLEPYSVDQTKSAVLRSCIDPESGLVSTSGTIDGVDFTVEDVTCGGIDATKWGGPADGLMCARELTVTVSGQQDSTNYLREYYTKRWLSPAYGYYGD